MSSESTKPHTTAHTSPPEPSNIKTKLMKLLSTVTVEPIMCFYVFAQLLALIAVNNLTFQMACRVNLGLNETICEDLLSKNNSMYEVLVQKEAAKLLVWKRPLSTIVPAVLILFMGSYSDRYKIRKPFLLLPLIGELFIAISFIICTAYKSVLPVEAIAGSEAIITAITGGLTTVKIAVYSYVADITSFNSRTTRLGIIQILSSIMSPLALALSGILLKIFGFYGVFSLRTIIFAIGLLYGLFVVKESSASVKKRTRNLCVTFFDPKHVKETFEIVVNKKSDQMFKIFLLMVSFVIVKGANAGEMDMLFLYTRVKFQWDEVTFGLYSMYDIVIRLIGSALAISIFSQWLKLDDLLIALITFSSKIFGSVLFAFCPSPWLFYVASVISLLCDYQTVPIRSLASKLVSENELGRLQSLFGLCEALAPSIFAPLYSAVYRSTVDSVPGAYYLAGAGALLPVMPAYAILYLLHRKEPAENVEDKVTPDTFKYIVPLASVISLLCDYQTVPIRSLASKLVSENELGRLQSLFGLCEALAPSIFAPLYSAVYRSTVDSVPGAYYLAGAGALLPVMPAYAILYLLHRKEPAENVEDKVTPDTFKYIVPLGEYL